MRDYLLVVSLTCLLSICNTAQSKALDISSGSLSLYDNSGNVVFLDDAITGYVDTNGTWSIASDASIFGLTWNAHSGNIIGPGTYDTEPPINNIGQNQLAGVIYFDWVENGVNNDLIYNVFEKSGNKYMPTDSDGNGIPGHELLGGPFAGLDIAIEFTVVPIPSAVWLFGSGLLGLIGIARRKKYND